MRVPDLCPHPQEVLRFEPDRRCAAATTLHRSVDLPPQGYEVWVEPDEVRLAAADDAGRRYGEGTLEQLRSADGTLPVIHIRDWPDLAVRGFMLDVSRSRVPTRETLDRLVDLLEIGRYNHLQLYVEHTFAYQAHEVVWRDASPLTGGDLQWLDARCRQAGIELAGNQNCFGHMERWFEVDRYRDRAESPDSPAPNTLAPTPDNASFVLDLVREQMSFLSSRTVNIGFDEPFELGHGRSSRAVAERGLGAVFAEQLDRVARPLIAEGFEVQYWADVARSHPGELTLLPEVGATAVAWTYEAPRDQLPEALQPVVARLSAMGVDVQSHMGFDHNVAPLVAADVPFWVAPGTATWNSLVGRIDNACGNLVDASRRGTELGAKGLLVTEWGDHGHLQPPAIGFAPILYGGAVSWCERTNATLDLAAAVDRLVFCDARGVMGSVIDRIGRTWAQTGRDALNASPLQAALCPHQIHPVVGEADVDAVRRVVATLDEAIDDLQRARLGCDDGAIVVDEVGTAIGLARHGAYRMLDSAGEPLLSRDDLRHDLSSLMDRHRDCWLRRSRPGGLDVSMAHLEKTLALYE